jgi:hypothetical protein
MDTILNALRLRTHPFRPDVDATGAPFNDPDILLKPLDPLVDPRLMNFYFDHYNWLGTIRDISPTDGFVTFPNKAQLGNLGPMIVLITGSDNTGRESLRNLILHKIASEFGAPLTIPAVLTSLNISDNIRSVATIFLYNYNLHEPKPAMDQLQRPFDLQTGEADVGKRDNYSTLFQIWRTFIQPVCTRPMVLLVEGVGNHDLWRAIYNSTSHVFRFIIVMTKEEAHAMACYKGLEGKNRVLIKAKPLGQETTRAYLAKRLGDERLGAVAGAPDLTPFTPNAVNALFEEGSTYKEGDLIEWSIGWLNETFSAVLDDHIAALNQRLQALQQQGGDLADLTQGELLIGPETIRATRKRLNQS